MPGVAVIVLVFGLLTIAAGGSVLFGPAEVSSLAGQTVSFVLWFNFLAGFFYLAAGYGFWKGEDWAQGLAGLIALTSAAVFVMLLFYIVDGHAFEVRTPVAMGFRLCVWVLIYLYARRVNYLRFSQPG